MDNEFVKYDELYNEWRDEVFKTIYDKSKYKNLIGEVPKGGGDLHINISVSENAVNEDYATGAPSGFVNRSSKPVKSQKAKLNRLKSKEKENKTNKYNDGVNSGSLGSSLYESEDITNLYNDVIEDIRNIVYGMSDIIYKDKKQNKDVVIIRKSTFISEIRIVHEGEEPYVRCSCVYGAAFNGEKQIFPIEFVENFIKHISYGDLFITPIDLSIDKFDVMFSDSADMDSYVNCVYRLLEDLYKKYNLKCDVLVKNNILKMRFYKEPLLVYGSKSPRELVDDGIYTTEHADFIKKYSRGFTLDEYYAKLLESSDVSKLGWDESIAITRSNILSESEKTKLRMVSESLLTEDTIFKKDKVYNLDDFIDGDNNILLITGIPGSGKTTMAYKLAEDYSATVIELDCFHCYKYDLNKNTHKKEIELVSKYLKENKLSPDDIPTDITISSFDKYFNPFFNWLLDTLKKDNKKYIIEGIQIMLCVPYNSIKNYPMICIETSKTKAMIRHWKRDKWEFDDIIKNFLSEIKLYHRWKGNMNSFVNESSKSNKSHNKHPIFIVCSYTGTIAGKVIRTYTHSVYTHSAISLDTSLEKLYSFNADNETNKLGGFSEEKLSNYIKYNKDTVIKVSCIFVNDREFTIVKRQLDKFLKNKKSTTYGYYDLVNIVRNKSMDMGSDAMSMVCSQFVSYIIQQADIDLLDKSPNLVTPKDLSSIVNPKMYLLYEGYAREYDKKKIDRIFRKLKIKAELIKECNDNIL